MARDSSAGASGDDGRTWRLAPLFHSRSLLLHTSLVQEPHTTAMAGLPSPCPDTGSPGADEATQEELWLYGGTPTQVPDEENGPTSRHKQSPGTVQEISSGSMVQKPALMQVTESGSDDDSDTDSDDVKVTIGDIQLSCMGSTGIQNVKGNRYGATGKLPPKGIDFAAPGSVNGVPVLEVDLDSFEEKPWRKPGADISDYFNYGFNEATWKVYCEKQRRLQLGLDNVYHAQSKENQIMVQQGRTGNVDKGGENGLLSSELPYNNPVYTEGKISYESNKNRNLVGTADAIVGEICNISRVEGRRWDIQEPDDVLFEVVGNQGYKPHGIVRHQQPPPALPPPPTIVSNLPVFNGLPPPLLFFHRPPAPVQTPAVLHPPVVLPPPLIPPPVLIPPSSSQNPTVMFNNRLPRNGYFSAGQGEMNYHSVLNAESSWVATVGKNTNNLGGSNWAPHRQREHELDRPRNQNLNNCTSENDRYANYNRERNYDYERKHRHSREHRWDREERCRSDPRQRGRDRDRDEASKHKSPSRRTQDREEKEIHWRHKKSKKSKRSKEDKSVNEEITNHGSRHDSSD